MNYFWILIVAVALFLLLRRIWSRSSSEIVDFRYPGAKPADLVQHDPRQPELSALEVTRYYFRNTEAESGPADPDVFYDEFFIDLRNAESGQTFQNSMFVCTPKGITQAMTEENWDSVIGTELLIVKRYDLPVILRAAMGHLEEIYESTLQLYSAKSRAVDPDLKV